MPKHDSVVHLNSTTLGAGEEREAEALTALDLHGEGLRVVDNTERPY